MQRKIRVTVWNEYHHEKSAEAIGKLYPKGIHGAIAEMLGKADEVRVTTALGTDLTVKVGTRPDGMYPVMGIIPFYSEVAIVPSFDSVNGVVVADGASERAYNQRGSP